MSTNHSNGRPRKLVSLQKPAGRSYQLYYRDPDTDKRIRLSTNTEDLAEAEEQRDKLEAKLTLDLPIAKTDPTGTQGPHMPWQDFVDAYLASPDVQAMRIGSAVHAESRLGIAERIIKPRTLGDMVDALDVLQAKLLAGAQSRYKRPRSSATVNGYMKTICAALNWAAHRKRKWVDPVSFDPVAVEKNKHMRGSPLTDEEFRVMLSVVPQVVGKEAAKSWRYLLRGVAASGLRLEELMNVSWDIPRTIRPVWKAGREPVLQFPAHLQKNKTTEEIPLCPWFEDLLCETPVELRTGWVFEPVSLDVRLGRRVRTDRMKADRVGDVITMIGKKAGIVVDEGNARTGAPPKYASCHDLRRTFAQHLADSDLPPALGAALMRHADVRTTQRYYQVADVQRDAGKIRQALREQKSAHAAKGELS